MKNLIAAAFTVGMLLPYSAFAGDRALTKPEERLIAKALGKQLKDPLSAQYRWPALPKSGKKHQRIGYCFEVNAKNSFGGYVGFKPIVGIVSEQDGHIVSFEYTTGLSDNDPALIDLNRKMCTTLGGKL